MRPTILDRYIIAQFTPYFLVSIIVFTLIFLTHQLLDITRFIVTYHIGLAAIILMLIYSLPYFMELVIPIASMMAVLLVFLRMSGDNEIIALRSSGVGIYTLLFPVACFCLATCLLTAFISIWALPKSRTALRQMVYETITNSPGIGVRENEFNTSFKDLTLYIDKYDKNDRRLSGIFIQDSQTVDAPVTICAPSGSFLFDPGQNIFRLSLNDGIINQVEPTNNKIHSIRFRRYEVNLDISQAVKRVVSSVRGEKEMGFGELMAHIRKMDKDSTRYVSALQTWHKKLSIPFACLALGLLAVPLGIQSRKAGSSSGVGLSLVCFLAYYLMLSAGELLVEAGHLSPLLSAWLPNIIMTAMGAGLLIWTSTGHDINLNSGRGISCRAGGLLSKTDRRTPSPDRSKNGKNRFR